MVAVLFRYIVRHRLIPTSTAVPSVAQEGLVYYLDPACPEPLRSAVLQGVNWWDQAFQVTIDPQN